MDFVNKCDFCNFNIPLSVWGGMEELNNTNNWSLFPIYTPINTFPVKQVQKPEETGGPFVRQAVFTCCFYIFSVK